MKNGEEILFVDSIPFHLESVTWYSYLVSIAKATGFHVEVRDCDGVSTDRDEKFCKEFADLE